MKKEQLLFILLFTVGVARAQSYTSSITFNKVSQQGLVLQLPYDENIAQHFIVDNLKKTGYDADTKGKLFWKQNKINGFFVFEGVMLKGAPVPVDLYFKVDTRSKNAKDQSTVSMLVSRGNEHFIDPGEDAAFVAAQNFLNSFVTESATYKLNLDVDNEEKVVSDAEKKLQKLQDDEKAINHKIEALQQELHTNQTNQEAQRQQIDTEHHKLSDLKGKSNPAPPAKQQ